MTGSFSQRRSGIPVSLVRASEPTRTLPIIGLSAAALPADTTRAARTGFDRYLTKPLDLPALTRALEDLLPR